MIGYACSNLTLQELKGITPARSCRISTLLKQPDARAYCIELARQNLKDTLEILKWNEKHNIKMYRLSASMFPFATHPDFSWELDSLEKEINEISKYIKQKEMRVSSHLPQFINLGSPSVEVVEKSVKDLEFTANFFEKMNLDSFCKIVIHGGGVYEDRAKTAKRFAKVYKSLSCSVKKYLAVENDEKSWTVLELFEIYKQTKIPIIIDYLHWNLNHEEGRSFEDDLKLALSTWKKGEKPKIHYSEQNTEKQRGAHSFYIDNIVVSECFDTMVEAKGKELAILPFIKGLKTSA